MGHSQPLQEYAVKQCLCLHLWATAICAVAEWEHSFSEQGSTILKADFPGSFALVNLPKALEVLLTDEWSWEAPDLGKGSPWYQACIASLCHAILNLQDGDLHFVDGLEALQVHRKNCSGTGPKKLQILWWEFPSEHWEALHEGSPMNFLITPQGELKLNTEMDEELKTAAGIFVDELKSLGVLIPATEELKENYPLFCMDKPFQPGKKQ